MSTTTPSLHDGNIYHYTGLDGLMGILRSKALWATDIRYLNDTGENTFGQQRLKALLPNCLQLKVSQQHSDSLFGFLNSFHQIRRAFVACFCANPDLLSQWRGYGRVGYSIGFDGETLQSLGASGPVFVLRDILYNDSDQLPRINAMIDASLDDPAYTQDINKWLINLMQELMTLIPLLKHPAFEEEHETRAEHWYVPGETLEFRSTQLGPTPFVSLPFGNSPETTALKEVWVGPTLHNQEARQGVEDLLETHGFQNVPVYNSEIPFRW